MAAPRLSIDYFTHPLGNTPGQHPPTTPSWRRRRSARSATRRCSSERISTPSPMPARGRSRARSSTGPVDGTLVGNPLMYVRQIVVPANSWLTKPMSGEYAIVVSAGAHTVSMTYQRVSNNCSTYPGNGVLTVEPIPFRSNLGTYGDAGSTAEAAMSPCSTRRPATSLSSSPTESRPTSPAGTGPAARGFISARPSSLGADESDPGPSAR